MEMGDGARPPSCQLFLILASLFVILGQVLCPGVACSLGPPGCWPSLESPEAAWHAGSPSAFDSTGPAWGLGRKRAPPLRSLHWDPSLEEGPRPAGCPLVATCSDCPRPEGGLGTFSWGSRSPVRLREAGRPHFC